MVRNVCLVLLLLFCSTGAFSQEVQVVSFSELEEHISKPSQKIKVYNYWATYCRPCIKEMPYFEKIGKEYESNVEVFFVSLDFVEDLEGKVKTFIQKKEIQHPVLLLDDIDYNSWIDKVNPEWSGAIPATDYVLPGGERIFHEGEYEEESLRNQIENLISKI